MRRQGLAVLVVQRSATRFFFSSRRRHTIFDCDWSSDVCSSDLDPEAGTVLHDDGGLAHPAAEPDGGADDLRRGPRRWRSEEHTSELQSQSNLVCRLLLEKKNNPGATRHGMEYHAA